MSRIFKHDKWYIDDTDKGWGESLTGFIARLQHQLILRQSEGYSDLIIGSDEESEYLAITGKRPATDEEQEQFECQQRQVKAKKKLNETQKQLYSKVLGELAGKSCEDIQEELNYESLSDDNEEQV